MKQWRTTYFHEEHHKNKSIPPDFQYFDEPEVQDKLYTKDKVSYLIKQVLTMDLTPTERRVIKMKLDEPTITQTDMSKKLKLTRQAVSISIKRAKRRNKILEAIL